MNLNTYLSQDGIVTKHVADALGVPPPLLSQWRKDRPIPETRCPDIEQVTAGAVTCEEMRDDLRWVRVPDESWPHPSGKPLLDHATASVTP